MANFAVVLLAGSSTRFSANTKKQFYLIKNKPLCVYSIQSFAANINIENIVLVSQKEDKEYLKQIINEFSINKVLNIVEGGSTRQESVKNALVFLKNYAKDDDNVLIHDSARPYIGEQVIDKLIDALNTFEGATTAIKMKDTLVNSDGETISNYVERSNVYKIQTPQAFKYGSIMKAHNTINKDCHDDTELLKLSGKEVALIEGSEKSLKVTDLDDIELLKEIL